MKDNYFIAVYTNKVKDYCDEVFFTNLYSLSQGEPVYIIDNTSGKNYCTALQKRFLDRNYHNFSVSHLDVPEHPAQSRFQRNVCESVSHLRHLFLTSTDIPYFLIIESDVVPPADLLQKFNDAIDCLNSRNPGWGIIGGLYYPEFHNYTFSTTTTSLYSTHHCLSGCTVYKRELLEKYPFRYDPANLVPFPDAFICFDSKKEFSFWNDHRIHCRHLHNPVNGLRVS